MYQYGVKSSAKLDTCHPVLDQIMRKALEISPYDITIIHGLRGRSLQDRLKAEGKSTKKYPHSKHNRTDDPLITDKFQISDAVDFGPYIDNKIYWGDTHIFAVIAGCIMAAAKELGYKVRWGGDWDSDGKTTDQTLMDYGHIEMVWET